MFVSLSAKSGHTGGGKDKRARACRHRHTHREEETETPVKPMRSIRETVVFCS